MCLSALQASLWGIMLHETLSRQAWTMVTVVPGAAALLGLLMVLFVKDGQSGSMEATADTNHAADPVSLTMNGETASARRPRV